MRSTRDKMRRRHERSDDQCSRALALLESGAAAEALAAFDNAIRNNPRSARALSGRAQAYQALGRLREACDDFRQAVRTGPEDAPAWCGLGVLLVRLYGDGPLGDYEDDPEAHDGLNEAIEALGRALALTPGLVEAHGARARAHAALHRHDAAAEDLGVVIGLCPGVPEPYFRRALVHHSHYEHHAAFEDVDRAIRLGLRDAQAFAMRAELAGIWLAGTDDGATVLADYDAALALAPDDPRIWKRRSVFCGKHEWFDEAIRGFSVLLGMEPDNASALHHRALAYSSSGRQIEAIADFDRLIALRPDSARAFYHRGNALRLEMRLHEALSDYSRAVALMPGCAFAYNNRGVVHGMLGDRQAALAD